MTCFYLDSCSWVKFYYQEQGSQWINNIFNQNNVFSCSTLGYLEVLAVLSRKRINSEINPTDFISKRNHLLNDWKAFIQIDIDNSIITEAENFLTNNYLKSPDTIHLSSAIFLQKQLSSKDPVIFVTSDQKLKNAAQNYGFSVVDPENQTI